MFSYYERRICVQPRANCPCLCVENCPFDIEHPCADITFADWISWAENFSNNLYAEAKYARGE